MLLCCCCCYQFVRFYGVYLTAYVVIQVLMVLSWQLMMLDEKGAVLHFLVSRAVGFGWRCDMFDQYILPVSYL